MANSRETVWYDPTPERGRGRWDDAGREKSAKSVVKALGRLDGSAGRVVVRTYDERIWVSASPFAGGLPPRGDAGADVPTRAGLTVRIEPPEPFSPAGSAVPATAHRALVEVRSWFQRPGLESPIPFAAHMDAAMRAMRGLGLVPRVDHETSDECRYDVRCENLAADVAAIVGAYLAVPFEPVDPSDDPRAAPAAALGDCQAVGKTKAKVAAILRG